ncbi:MAG: hypothetical protein IJW12_02865 [Opitutales bacterium]|nr:hypothetical protein [Opitutales bacterium]
MKKIIFAFTFLLGLTASFSGCLSYSRGYCDSTVFQRKNLNEAQRYPITYSVDYIQADFVERPLNGDNDTGFRESLRKALEETGLFSSVQYERSPSEDSYHIEFRVWRSGTDRSTAAGVGAVCGGTLFLFPGGVDETLDVSANIVLRNKTLVSFGKAESVRTVYWLPLLPFCISPIVTHNYVDDKLVGSLVNEVAKFHYQQFVMGRE